MQIPLDWLMAFLKGVTGTLVRTYTLASYLGEGHKISVRTGASPVGLGAFLVANGVIKEYAFDYVTQDDEERLGIATHGSSEGQPVVEALTVLAALRLWKPWWANQRVNLEVRSDSVSALIMLIKLKTSGVGTSLIARELALDIGDSLYEPNVAAHVPGVANLIADHLLRVTERSGTPMPRELRRATRVRFQIRDHNWWRTV